MLNPRSVTVRDASHIVYSLRDYSCPSYGTFLLKISGDIAKTQQLEMKFYNLV